MSHTDSETSVVFGIQHLSLNDGPGIRTTIFFKGCPLNCIWCHNPESWRQEPQLSFNSALCVGCMACKTVCPTGAHGGGPAHSVDYTKCRGCGACVEICCYDALSLAGRRYTVEELYSLIRHDLIYYNAGAERGGLTLSGGEPMMQVDFIERFLHRYENVHICMETCGFAPQADFTRISPLVDLFLFDYKVTDSAEHECLCGVDNELILENLDNLYHFGKEIILRLPLVPSVNDGDDHMQGIASLLQKYPRIQRAEIMAYHSMGVDKSFKYGLTPTLQLQTATNEQKEDWLKTLRALCPDRDIRFG